MAGDRGLLEFALAVVAWGAAIDAAGVVASFEEGVVGSDGGVLELAGPRAPGAGVPGRGAVVRHDGLAAGVGIRSHAAAIVAVGSE